MAAMKIRLLPSIMAVGAVAFGLQVANFTTGVSALSSAAIAEEAPAKAQPVQDDVSQELLTDVDAGFLNRSEVELLRDLSKRREALDEREQQIAMQERLLQATEKRIDGKIVELKALENEISALIGQHEAQEDAELNNLVSVYEKMKPKDAAQIFQRLDMAIQLSVAKRMKNTKMAPIMSKMDPDAAKKLSTALAVRQSLPTLNKERRNGE